MPDDTANEPVTQMVTTHCPYCALNCGLQLNVADGLIVGQTRWKESPLTNGALCSKGVTAYKQVDHPDRLTVPLVRRNGTLQEASWDEALNLAAEGFLRLRSKYGPDTNAVLSGGSLTNEKVYLVGKLARLAFGTRHVDYNGRLCMATAAAAHQMAFGADRMMTPLAELRRADVAVVVGANLSAAFPVTIPPLLQGVRRREGRIIVVDPRSSRFIRDGDLHIQLRPGTDATLFGGLLREVLAQGLVDHEFIQRRTNGLAEAAKAVEQYTLDEVAKICDVPAALVQEAALVIGSTSRCMYFHGRGPEQQAGGVPNVLSITNLGLACGHVGGPGRGINMLTGQRNGQGGREWGQRCTQLPAGRRIDDPNDRRVVAERWGVEPERLPGPGKTYVEILQAAGRREIKGLLSICTNMSVSAPNLAEVATQMASLDHVVMIDPFLSASTEHADIVLPGSTFAEEEGTITTIEGRVVRCDQAVAPLPGFSDIDIITQLAERLGEVELFTFRSGREIFDEMRMVSAGGPVDYAGITYDRLRAEGGVFWPCPDADHPGTPQLFTEEFAHPDGRARFHPVEPIAPPSQTTIDRPWVLTNGRVLAQFLSGNQTMRIPEQNAKCPKAILEVHPTTADSCGLVPDEMARLTSQLASSDVAWVANPGLRQDTLFLPYHWPECNRLVADDLDNISKIPAFKFTPVALGPVPLDEESEQTHRPVDIDLVEAKQWTSR